MHDILFIVMSHVPHHVSWLNLLPASANTLVQANKQVLKSTVFSVMLAVQTCTCTVHFVDIYRFYISTGSSLMLYTHACTCTYTNIETAAQTCIELS